MSDAENDGVVTEVQVAAEHLAALLLAVHEGSEGAEAPRPHPWKYDNVIDIARARVADLDLSGFRPSKVDVVEPRVVAGVVIIKTAASVDVLFWLDATTATARFGGARGGESDTTGRSTQLARFLATQTAAVLAADEINHTIHL
ncbi:hypothetical protein [Antrihabitans stalactiti]|uniref:Uncharacterized protein n=1 Tax=Antrihabitans stalactiti TaxID=2584121 RepID=A0A848K8F6_9NOCA|nr:hypothetical protein [Antrihabitans stalactiti]NMN95093.1 hypothetical protein [Antrihabitans stalactiti]